MWLSERYYRLLLLVFALFLGLRIQRARARRPQAPLPAFGLGVILCFTALYLVYYGAGRYHQPMLPWMMVYIGNLVRDW